MVSIITSAGTLRAILCFIDPNNTPKIAYDKDEYAKPLIAKLKKSVGDYDGSQSVTIIFSVGEKDEKELMRQFNGVCGNIKDIIGTLEKYTNEE